jgi:hypothetical protein
MYGSEKSTYVDLSEITAKSLANVLTFYGNRTENHISGTLRGTYEYNPLNHR